MAEIRVSIILTEEIRRRLEAVPGQQGPAFRYRLCRDMLARAGDMIFLFPAQIGELRDQQISLPVDLNRDADWLPLLTHRLLASERRSVDPQNESEEPEKERIAEGRELIALVASTYMNQGGTKAESLKAATDAWQPGDDFDKLYKRGIQRIGKAR